VPRKEKIGKAIQAYGRYVFENAVLPSRGFHIEESRFSKE
jgi:hypothetical protein